MCAENVRFKARTNYNISFYILIWIIIFRHWKWETEIYLASINYYSVVLPQNMLIYFDVVK